MGRVERSLDRATGGNGRARLEELLVAVEELKEHPRVIFVPKWGLALSDPTRVLILSLLKRKGELSATELQAALGATHATISEHMKLLEDVGAVKSREHRP